MRSRASRAKLKIGLSTARWGRGTDTDPQVAARVREVARLLELLGHAVEELNDDAICDWETMWSGYMTQWLSSRSLFTTMAADKGIPTSDLRNLLNPMTWRHYEAADRYDKFDIFRMMNANNTVTRQFGALMDRYDMLLTPTLAIRVPEANGPYSLLRDEPLDPWVNRLADACRYTMPGNETGLPGDQHPRRPGQRRPADRRAALRQFRARGSAAADGCTGRTGASRSGSALFRQCT